MLKTLKIICAICATVMAVPYLGAHIFTVSQIGLLLVILYGLTAYQCHKEKTNILGSTIGFIGTFFGGIIVLGALFQAVAAFFLWKDLWAGYRTTRSKKETKLGPEGIVTEEDLRE